MSLNAPRWWGLPIPKDHDTVTFVREKTPPPAPIPVPELNDVVVALGWSESGLRYETRFRVI